MSPFISTSSENDLDVQFNIESPDINTIIKNQEEIKNRFDKLEGIETSLNFIDQQILGGLSPEIKQRVEICLNFLSPNNRKLLAERIGKLALTNFRDDSYIKESLPFSYKQEQKFYLELQQYLALIRNSILSQDYSNIQVPRVQQSFPDPNLYIYSLKILKGEFSEDINLPKDINIKAKKELENRIDYLIKRISKREA